MATSASLGDEQGLIRLQSYESTNRRLCIGLNTLLDIPDDYQRRWTRLIGDLATQYNITSNMPSNEDVARLIQVAVGCERQVGKYTIALKSGIIICKFLRSTRDFSGNFHRSIDLMTFLAALQETYYAASQIGHPRAYAQIRKMIDALSNDHTHDARILRLKYSVEGQWHYTFGPLHSRYKLTMQSHRREFCYARTVLHETGLALDIPCIAMRASCGLHDYLNAELYLDAVPSDFEDLHKKLLDQRDQGFSMLSKTPDLVALYEEDFLYDKILLSRYYAKIKRDDRAIVDMPAPSRSPNPLIKADIDFQLGKIKAEARFDRFSGQYSIDEIRAHFESAVRLYGLAGAGSKASRVQVTRKQFRV